MIKQNCLDEKQTFENELEFFCIDDYLTMLCLIPVFLTNVTLASENTQLLMDVIRH